MSYGQGNGETRYIYASGSEALIDTDADGLPNEAENAPRTPNTSDD